MGHSNTLPSDIKTYIRSLGEHSTLQDFLDIQDLLKIFHENPPFGVSIIYEVEFNCKLKCKKQFPSCEHSKNFGFRCQLLYSIRRDNIDHEGFEQHSFKRRLVTPFTLMDYGLLNKLWIKKQTPCKNSLTKWE